MPKDIYGGPHGAIAQLAGLADWFEHQREFCFYSSSVLIIYEGAATSADAAAVSIRLVRTLVIDNSYCHRAALPTKGSPRISTTSSRIGPAVPHSGLSR